MKKIISLLLLTGLFLSSCTNDDSSSEDPKILSGENKITSFKLQINNEFIDGNINEVTKTIVFNLAGANLNSLIPIIDYSAKSTLSPSENDAQNFNNEVIYTVIAENGDTNAYRVIVNNRPLSEESKILSFSLEINNQTIDAIIDEEKKVITFNAGLFNIKSLTPKITISQYASISPEINSLQNFEEIINYTVTSENGSTTIYKVVANPPKITGISGIGGTLTLNPSLFYSGAEIFVVGDFINPDRPNAKLYLSDGINKYLLPIIKSEPYSVDEFTIVYNLYTKIPENIPTYNNYKMVYEANDYFSESESYIDVLMDNSPKPISLNQNVYRVNDILIITGDNLTNMIAIPSNGSIFLIQESGNYDITVNDEKTEIRLTLDNFQLFPSYYGRPPEEKIITILGPNRRAGATIIANFN